MSFDELYEKWVVAYDLLGKEELDEDGDTIEGVDDLDFFDVCVGFCASHGVGYEKACNFYHKICIERGKY